MFKSVDDFIRNGHTLDEETRKLELSNFNAIDRENIEAREFIAYWAYPAGRFKKNLFKTTISAFGQTYYPIVGWDPDQLSEADIEKGVKITPARKQIMRLKKKTLMNSRDGQTYTLWG